MIIKLTKSLADLFNKPYTYEFVDEVPNRPKKKKVYIIEHEDYSWQAVMVCPCGCKKILQMNLISDHKPFWEYKLEKRNRATLSPSVHRVVGCRSHFFVKKGKIIWA